MLFSVGQHTIIAVFAMLSHETVGQHQHQSIDCSIVPTQENQNRWNTAIPTVMPYQATTMGMGQQPKIGLFFHLVPQYSDLWRRIHRLRHAHHPYSSYSPHPSTQHPNRARQIQHHHPPRLPHPLCPNVHSRQMTQPVPQRHPPLHTRAQPGPAPPKIRAQSPKACDGRTPRRGTG